MGYFVGAISGTSIDGLDLALIEVDSDSVKVKHAITVPFPPKLRSSLLDLTTSATQDIVHLGHSHADLGHFIGEQIAQFISTLGYSKSDIVAIGSHGQTVRHVPNGSFSFSYQIGDANRIAAVTGIDTVADFRSADIAVGGQGAPLVPIFHDRVYRSDKVDRVIANIGGISNVTHLPSDSTSVIIGFDTGPGNALLDAWTQHHFDRNFDHDGELANSGAVVEDLLGQFLTDSWFAIEPPKSTGREYFNLSYIEQNIQFAGVNGSPIDVLTTLAELTAMSLSRAICGWCCDSGDVVVCGGGRLNKYLMSRLEYLLPDHSVLKSDALGINGDAVEAATFAYLAYLFVSREVGNIPSVTGANRGRVLGCLYPA
ncbi:MAG: anhydro-N-acetylmuramic acid kinase [Gammaproteobacteria bacterium]|nr:anhydro-N-acetylmuramic acid kinase [Gammaproteobacteria bacterium]MYF39038.1 anhydro-N-acetylmuramic acid kinase [Gammaproteobacteria bacterium]